MFQKYHRNCSIQMRFFLLLIISVFASKEKEITENFAPNSLQNSAKNTILVKIEEDEYVKKHSSHYFGVFYHKLNENWCARRWSKKERKYVYNGYSYKDEETAAHASDTLARELIADGEKGHKLIFPEDNTLVYPEKTSQFIGVTYREKIKNWCARRWSKNEGKRFYNGTAYKDEKTAAHASDTLARKLIANGEKGHKLNFPDDSTEVRPEKTSQYIGVTYHKRDGIWAAHRYNKRENRTVHDGSYKDEETAAHASDTLARKLIANGEKSHKLNFPNQIKENPKTQNNKRKRPADFNDSQKYGQSLDK